MLTAFELDREVRTLLLKELAKRAAHYHAETAFNAKLGGLDRARINAVQARYWDWLRAAVEDDYQLNATDTWVIAHLSAPIARSVRAKAKTKAEKTRQTITTGAAA